MFRKLKIQIVSFNLIVLTVLMVVALTVVYKQNEERIEEAERARFEWDAYQFVQGNKMQEIVLYEVSESSSGTNELTLTTLNISDSKDTPKKETRYFESDFSGSIKDEQGKTIGIMGEGEAYDFQIFSETHRQHPYFSSDKSTLIYEPSFNLINSFYHDCFDIGGTIFGNPDELIVGPGGKVSTVLISSNGGPEEEMQAVSYKKPKSNPNPYRSVYKDYAEYFIEANEPGKEMPDKAIYTSQFIPRDVYLKGLEEYWDKLKNNSDNPYERSFKIGDQYWLYKAIGSNSAATGEIYPSYSSLSENEQQLLSDYALLVWDATDAFKRLEKLRSTFVLYGTIAFFAFLLVSLLIAQLVVRPVEKSWNRQRQFMSDASHELKTPLSVIGFYQELLRKDSSQTIEKQKEKLDAIESETARMDKLVTELLDLSKGDESPVEAGTVDLSQLVREVCSSFETLAFEKGVALNSEIAPNLSVMAEADSLKTAFTALLDNAVKYTPKDNQIQAKLVQERNHAVFILRNDGIGIAKDDLAKLFDRFYRVDDARTRETGGFGLGLSIAQNAVRRSKGTIQAASDDNLVTITVRFRVA